jgi:hypothetical protein
VQIAGQQVAVHVHREPRVPVPQDALNGAGVGARHEQQAGGRSAMSALPPKAPCWARCWSTVSIAHLAIVSDDAGQFNVLLHALCWIHAERVLATTSGDSGGGASIFSA